MTIDPILLSVYARTFRSITDEMSLSMERATRSPILCEAKDYVTGLYDAEGRMLSRPRTCPSSLSRWLRCANTSAIISATTSIPET